MLTDLAKHSHVTSASEDDDWSNSKHTRVFFNRNQFQCYHNNRGFCSFRDHCRYQHYHKVCPKTVCRVNECKFRHPVICKYKETCKFVQKGICAFKHNPLSKLGGSENVKTKTEEYDEDIEKLKREMLDLKNDIGVKENELLEYKIKEEEQSKIVKELLEKVKREATENKIVDDILKEENKLMKDKSIDDDVKIETLEIKIKVLEEENKKLGIKTEELEESAKGFNSRNKTNNFEVSEQREIFC